MPRERGVKRLRRTAMIANASLQSRQVQEGVVSGLRQPSLLVQMQHKATAMRPSSLSHLEGQSLASSSSLSKTYLSDLLGSIQSGHINISMLANGLVMNNANETPINIAAKVQDFYLPTLGASYPALNTERFPPVTHGECSRCLPPVSNHSSSCLPLVLDQSALYLSPVSNHSSPYLPPVLDHSSFYSSPILDQSSIAAHAIPPMYGWTNDQNDPPVNSISIAHKRKFSNASKGKSPYYSPPATSLPHDSHIEPPPHGLPSTFFWSTDKNSPYVNSVPGTQKPHSGFGPTTIGPSRMNTSSRIMDATGAYEVPEENMIPCLICWRVQPPMVACIQDKTGVVRAELDFWIACLVCGGLFHMNCLGFTNFQDLPLTTLFSPEGYKCCFC